MSSLIISIECIQLPPAIAARHLALKMARSNVFVILLLSILVAVNGASVKDVLKSNTTSPDQLSIAALADGKQAYSYAEVRPGAKMFWWLYYAGDEDDDKAFEKYPLVIFLAGGPGDSSTGFSNFAEIGPKTEKFPEDRKGSWLEFANLLFIDSPVGSGYSYVDKLELLVKKDEEIVADLVNCVQVFYKQRPEFKKIPTYIFGESYGGKVAISLAAELHRRKIAKEIKLVGVGIGNGAIDLPRSASSWPEYLHKISLIDLREKAEAEVLVKKLLEDVTGGKGKESFDGWLKLWETLQNSTHYVDFHNILLGNKFYPGSGYEDPLDKLMNEKIKPILRIIPQDVKWNGQAQAVFFALGPVFMNPVVKQVEYVLNNTDLKVAVYNGQLDVIIPTPSVESWIENLQWDLVGEFSKAKKEQISGKIAEPAVFRKKAGKLSFYTILKAGHSSPRDQLKPSTDMLQDFFKAK